KRLQLSQESVKMLILLLLSQLWANEIETQNIRELEDRLPKFLDLVDIRDSQEIVERGDRRPIKPVDLTDIKASEMKKSYLISGARIFDDENNKAYAVSKGFYVKHHI